MMRKLLGKGAAKPRSKPQPPKARSEPKPEPQDGNRAVGRSELTLSERLQLQSERGDATSWPAGDSSTFAQPSETIVPSPEASAEPSAPRRNSGNAARHSVVGPSMVIMGELQAAEDLTIAGRLEGSVTHTAHRLIVAKTGVVKANIQTRNLIVEGRVEGDIECRNSVVLKDTAQVTGNIHTVRISIADGAQFNGKIVMVEARKRPE